MPIDKLRYHNRPKISDIATMPPTKKSNRLQADQNYIAVVRENEDYRPVGELMVTAHALLEEASVSVDRSRQVRIGALFTLASCVEAFCQTLGPRILQDVWAKSAGNVERAGVMTKLKLLAARLKVEGFDETKAPWNSVKELMDARHQLAHPKPAPVTRTFRVVTTPSVFEDEASRSELLWNYRYPILAAGKLELIAKDVISSLDLLLAADGQDSSMLTTMSSSEVEVDWHEIVNS